MVQRGIPKDFLWGASIAAHQVEGNMRNQWSAWEQQHAARLASTFTQRLAWLPNLTVVEKQGTDPNNYVSGNGVEHYARYSEDFSILEELGMNAFRFSIEWSRLEPSEGQWDEQAIKHYRKYIADLKKRGIEPVLSLWHWTMPTWFTDKGGFAKRRNIHYFERFVRKVGAEYGSTLRYVLTLNEPNVYAVFSYMTGEWPPQKRNPLLTFRVYRHLAMAHQRAYHALKAANGQIKVGIPMQLADMQPLDPQNKLQHLQVRIQAYIWNWWFMDRIKAQLDFVGLNYYFTQYINTVGRIRNPKEPVSDLGWYMEPKGIARVMRTLWQRYHLPILITENGLADATDAHRQWWLEQTIDAMQEVLGEGVRLLGYLHWSLLDNFEWAYGWWPKFGLVAVDRTTMKRTIRPSARWLACRIKDL